MKDFYRNLNLTILISTYFSDPARRVRLEQGERLMTEAGYNDRLYFVLRGELEGYVGGEGEGDGPETLLLTFEPGMFVGVFSYFSGTYVSSLTVKAAVESELAYIDSRQAPALLESGESLYEQFLPVVMADLAHRHHRAQEIALEKEQATRALIDSEKLVSLGQLAAGISHELNNALAVLQGNTVWLIDVLPTLLDDPVLAPFLARGMMKGRHLSSRDIRHRRKEIAALLKLPPALCETLAQTGMSDAELREVAPLLRERGEAAARYWELGANLHGMRIAADQASHVVRSVKSLGARHAREVVDLDVNDTLREAVALLQSPLRKITLDMGLNPLPMVRANKGELVQVWVNLIKNACESLVAAKTPAPTITVRSVAERGRISVRITDNGPGIDADIRERIFQPNVTTKVRGLSFGLGLGLTIVARLVADNGGTIAVESDPGETVFTVTLPSGTRRRG